MCGRQLGPDDTRRAVETIVRNATLQEDMIRGLLDMSSLLNGRLRLQVAPVDLRLLTPGPGLSSTFTIRLLLSPYAPAEAVSVAPQVVATSPLRVPVAPGPRPGGVA